MYRFLIPLFALALLIGCSSTDSVTDADATPPPAPAALPTLPPPDAAMQQAPAIELLSGLHTVVLATSQGDVTLELDADKAPKAVTNFVALAKAGYYNGLTFHRVIPDFMVQGGDPNGDGTGGTSIFGETFEDEQSDLQMVRGSVAMANRGPNTNGSQFFIVQAPATPWLQGRHTVFGRVTEGMEIVDAISKVSRDPSDKPVEPVTFAVEAQN